MLDRDAKAVTPLSHDLRPILRCLAQSGALRDALSGICRITVEQGLFNRARIGRYDRSSNELTWIAEAADEKGGNGSETTSVPILSNGSQWGVLSASRSTEGSSGVEDLAYLEDTCFVMGLAIESRRFGDDNYPAPQVGHLARAATALAGQHSLHAPRGSEQAKSDFLAAVAHELRSPLSTVIGFTGLMLQKLPGPLNPEQQRQLELIRTSVGRHLDLIKDLLDLARLALGQTGVQKLPFDLRDAARLVAARAELAAAEKGLVLRCQLPELPIPAVGDHSLIERVMTEIINNAIKFTDRGEVKLKVFTRAPDHGCIQISDTGIGIAPSARPRLFIAFGYAGHGKTHQNEGSRLGLALCKGLIDLVHGSIHVDSDPERGSTFTIHFPLQSQNKLT